jgi:hypothetical protein
MTMRCGIARRSQLGITLLLAVATGCSGGTTKTLDAKGLCQQHYSSLVRAQASRAGDLRTSGGPLGVKSSKTHFRSLPDAAFVAVCLVAGGGGQALDKVWGVPRSGSPELLWEQSGSGDFIPPT